jgi:hypothetical protein
MQPRAPTRRLGKCKFTPTTPNPTPIAAPIANAINQRQRIPLEPLELFRATKRTNAMKSEAVMSVLIVMALVWLCESIHQTEVGQFKSIPATEPNRR